MKPVANMQNKISKPKRIEIFSWAMFDFANSGYTTVVLTAVFNTYFVGVVAAGGESGAATFLWTITTAIANIVVLISAPLIGAMVDQTASKKRFLFVATLSCVLATACLYFVGPGDVVLAMTLIIIANIMFYTGENLISAFLPEITTPEKMGRISAMGWTLGYLGGMLTLVLCLAYINSATSRGETAAQFVPASMLIVAVVFALAAAPTFIWLKERAQAKPATSEGNLVRQAYRRLKQTFEHARSFQDLFRFLITLTVFHSGIMTVIVLAAIYAQEEMGFTTEDTIKLILIVNVSAAVGAALFGFIQDKIGSKKTLMTTLILWIISMVYLFQLDDRFSFWIAANLIGIALGSSQSAGRAMIGLFSPVERCGEFFGLWGLATKLAAVCGPLCYGFITYVTAGNHRIALLSTTVFFFLGLILLLTVNESRGIKAAHGETD